MRCRFRNTNANLITARSEGVPGAINLIAATTPVDIFFQDFLNLFTYKGTRKRTNVADLRFQKS